MNKTHVLYLSYDGMTDSLGQSQVIPYLQGLSKKGYCFTLISFEKEKRYNEKREQIEALLNESGIRWIPCKYHKTPLVISTLFDLWKMSRKAKRVHKNLRVTIVHCRSYLSALIGLRMKKKYGIKFLFDMRGFWADERIEGDIWNQNNLIFKGVYSFFKSREKLFLEKADYTISLTNNARSTIHNWEHIRNNPIPIKVIPCCTDLHLFDKNRVDHWQSVQLRGNLGIGKNDFVLLYLGSIGTWYMLDEMLDFFKILLTYKPEARFLFLTKDDPQRIVTSAANKGVGADCLIITPVERSILPQYIALAHLSIFFIRPVFSKKASCPTKQGEIMSMGVPIVCNTNVGDTTEIIQQTGSGVVIAEFNSQCYYVVCSELEALLSIPAKTIRNGAEKHFSLEEGVRAYQYVYENMS